MRLSKPVNLLTQQRLLLNKIFHIKDSLWKILIFDHFNYILTSSLFKMKDLRQKNITLYFNLKEKRQQLYGVTVIYLIQPTMENINAIVDDFVHDLYSSVSIHFTMQPSPHLLSNFAKILSKQKPNSLSKIIKIEHSCIGFQPIDTKMAILPSNNELINLLLNLKGQPIFFYKKKDQQKVQLLKERLNVSNFGVNLQRIEQSENKQNISKNSNTLVLILNRQQDLYPIFSHGLSYSSLIQNIYEMKQNGHKIIQNKEIIELDLNDEIWLDRKTMLVSQMQLEKQCSKIQSKMMNLKNKMQQYTELTQKNKKIQWHLHTAQFLIKQATKRRLNEFHQVESQIYEKKILSKDNKIDMIQLLKNAPLIEDKIRLMLVYISFAKPIDKKQLDELQNYCKQIKTNSQYNRIKNQRIKNQLNIQNSIGRSQKIKKLAKGFIDNLKQPQNKYFITQLIEKIQKLNIKQIKQLGLQISSLKRNQLQQIPHDAKINYIVIYIIGGICYNQYTNLMQYQSNCIYTGDCICNFRKYV